MADETNEYATWLPVIGKSLAYLCLAKAMEREPDKYSDIVAKAKFLESLGLSHKDAAEASGSTSESVRVAKFKRKKAKKSGKKSKTRARRR